MSHRTFVATPSDAGQPLLAWLARQLQRSPRDLAPLFDARRVTINGVPANIKQRLRAGQRVEVRLLDEATPRRKNPTPQAPTQLSRSIVRYLDADLLVVDKPAGVTTMRHAEEAREFGARGRKYLPPTLADLLPGLLREIDPGRAPVVRAVHRLDKETSGLVVFARTIPAERHLGQQFRVHSIERVYVALVRGKAKEGRIESWLIADRGDGRRGSGPKSEGQRAVTQVRVVEELGEYTLIECRLETGRTHQVRIHLGEAGTPLCGERIYDRPLHGRPLPDGSGAKRILLHAYGLAIDHPTTGARMEWTVDPPRDFEAVLTRLRR
jgi:23S rRNA pseudouridine1911/1915/1917 synthase